MVVLLVVLNFTGTAHPCCANANHVVYVRILEWGEHFTKWLRDYCKIFLLGHSHLLLKGFMYHFTLLYLRIKLRRLSLKCLFLQCWWLQPDFEISLHQLVITELIWSRTVICRSFRLLSGVIDCLAVVKEELSLSFKGIFTCAEGESNELWRYYLFLVFNLVIFINFLTFSVFVNFLNRWRLEKLLPFLHALCHYRNFWLLANLREVHSANLAETLEVASLLRARDELTLNNKLLKVCRIMEASFNSPITIAAFNSFLWLRLLFLLIIHLSSSSLLQHELLELVNDEVLADPSDAILAVLLGVDPDNASWLLALLILFSLVMEYALWDVL